MIYLIINATAPFRYQYMKTPKRGKKEIDLLPTI